MKKRNKRQQNWLSQERSMIKFQMSEAKLRNILSWVKFLNKPRKPSDDELPF